jgi:hypothetical protein
MRARSGAKEEMKKIELKTLAGNRSRNHEAMC